MSDTTHHHKTAGSVTWWKTCLHHNPKHFKMRELTESKLLFSHSSDTHNVLCRSKVSIGNNALGPAGVSRVRERRHRPGSLDEVLTDAMQSWELLSGHYGLNRQKIGFPGCYEILLRSYYAAQNERGDNPRHLYSHLSTNIHITKAACVSKSSFA